MTWKLMENAISFNDRMSLIKFILSSKKFTNGIKVKEFENLWNDWLGSRNSLFVSSGSSANFLLIAAVKEFYGLKNGDKVLLPACTWMTNVSPVIQLGLKPIFCDIQLPDFSFDPHEVESISKKHDIKLIFVTHLLGFSSIARTSGFLQKTFPNAIIIDDVCESHGCKNPDGSNVGSDSIGATFSTYFGHHLTSIEGGFVSTNNPELYDLMKMKRSHGMSRESMYHEKYSKTNPNIDSSFLFVTDGYNFRNTELSAVLGLSQLKNLNSSIDIRNKNYKRFCSIVCDLNNILYPIEYLKTSSNFCFPIICRNMQLKEKLQYKLLANHIEYRPIVSGNILKHPFLKNYKLSTKRKQSFVDVIHNNGLYIGNNQFVNDNNLNLLAGILEDL